VGINLTGLSFLLRNKVLLQSSYGLFIRFHFPLRITRNRVVGTISKPIHCGARRTFATQVQNLGSVKDAQAQLRHANASTTLGVYTQEIPESVRETVEALDRKLFGETVEENQRVN